MIVTFILFRTHIPVTEVYSICMSLWISYVDISLNAKHRTCALGPIETKHWAPMAADHSARGSMKTGVKPETVCELQDTNDHRQVERKWRLPISVGKLSALEGRLMNLCT